MQLKTYCYFNLKTFNFELVCSYALLAPMLCPFIQTDLHFEQILIVFLPLLSIMIILYSFFFFEYFSFIHFHSVKPPSYSLLSAKQCSNFHTYLNCLNNIRLGRRWSVYVHVSFGLPGEYRCKELGEAVEELFLYNIFLNCERSSLQIFPLCFTFLLQIFSVYQLFFLHHHHHHHLFSQKVFI